MHRLVLAVAAVALLLPGRAHAELVVSVSTSQQQAAVVVDGEEFYRWPVSTGTRGHDTPTGSFRPQRLERHWYSRQYHLTPMPWAMFFHRGYALHGTMESYNLGHAASHGCVRLRPDKAAVLYALMRRQGLSNTKVVVMNGPLPAAPGAQPAADAAPPPERVATATAEVASRPVEYAAKAHRAFGAAHDGDVDEPVAAAKFHAAIRGDHRRQARGDGVVYRVSAGSDEGRILRERQAWLRSLDRKYGIKQGMTR